MEQQSTTIVKSQKLTEKVPYMLSTVISHDGTKIGYRKYGDGPSLVLVQGGMGNAYNFDTLAKALAKHFTVYAYDRRGRGLSPYPNQDYTIEDDVADLNAVLIKTNCHNVFGLSTGGLIVLKASLVLTAIKKIAIYEPGLSINGSTPLAWAERYEREMAQGDIPAALVTGMLGPQMGPPFMRYIPRPLLKLFTKRIIAQEQALGTGDYSSLQELAPTLHHDITLLKTMSDTIAAFRTMTHPTLLLNGSKSADFQRFSVASLAKVLPNSKYIELVGLNHGGPWNYDKNRNPHGNPKVVAQELIKFFTENQ